MRWLCAKIRALTASVLESLPRRRREERTRNVPRSSLEDALATRVLTLNIAAAAAPRAERILRWLRRKHVDILVLSETSAGPGTTLIAEGLESDGFSIFSAEHGRDRGVLVAVRSRAATELEQVSVTLPWRARAVVIDGESPAVVIGIYVPSRDRSPEKVARKREFLDSLTHSLRSLPDELLANLVLLGDYNAVARGHDPALPGFFPYEYNFHDELADLGLRPAHEVKPWGAHPYSWIGRTGIGYLYDYAHLGAGVCDRLLHCRYLHEPRTQRLSDHAALAFRLRLS
jgi:exodeoxyribonuclease III